MNSLFTAAFEDRAIAGHFSAASWVAALVRVEAALAAAQAGVGLIPQTAADAIAHKAKSFAPDLARLEAATARDGFPIIGLVEQLRAHVGEPAGEFVHWGATTQDIVDTALVLQLRVSLDSIEQRLVETAEAFADLAQRHRRTVMVGRTHLQAAVPTTFGLKAAGWLAPLVRHRQRLRELRPRLSVVQLGGAGGTLASLGEQGPAVATALAAALGLGAPSAPWQAQRDRLLEGAGWLALVATSLAKFAGDVLLLSQPEVGEVAEPGDGDRGGSSAMPQKRNPVLSETVAIACRTVGSHFTALMTAPPPEHERGTQSGQTELLHLPAMCALTGGALQAATQLARGLVVNGDRLAVNVAATHGVMLAEAATVVLSRHMDRASARRLVREACTTAVAEKRPLLEIIRARPEAKALVNELSMGEADYLGAALVFIDRVLADYALQSPGSK